MQIRDLPYPDPGVPDVRSGPRFLLWLGRNQLGGQLRSLAWGLLHFGSIAGLPYAVGIAVEAVLDRSGGRLALSGVLLILLGLAIAAGDTMLHRTAVTNWITAAARVQQLLARKTAQLGSVLTRRVAAGEVVSVSTGDVEKIGWFVEALSRFAAAACTILLACVGLLIYQPALGLVVAVGVPVLALAVLPLLPRATRRADLQREKAGRATELASDTVAGLRVLRGIGGEDLFLDRYRRASQEVRTAAVRSARMWAVISATQVLLPGLLLIALVWHGVHLAREGRITVAELVTVYSAVMMLNYPLRHFEEIAMAYSFSRPSAKRAARVLALERTEPGAAPTASPAQDQQAAAPPKQGKAASDSLGGATAVAPSQRVDVPPSGGEQPPSHRRERALAGGSRHPGDLFDPATGLLAPAGRLTAVVCGDPDEAGRLAERLGGHPTFEDAANLPSVRLGDVALDEMPLFDARTHVLVQDKDPVLLSGTLQALLDVPSSGTVAPAEALAAAQCSDVLDALAQASVSDDPMAAHLTERGRSLSGGQRQRLALARSLVTDPDTLVLDEPTSAVDSHTEARVADGIRRLRSGRTTVVLTSSPLLLDRAERVVFLTDGAVAAVGAHRDLMHSEPRYRAVVTRETDDEQTAVAESGPAGFDPDFEADFEPKISTATASANATARTTASNLEETA
ncbi:ABC transporter ATP-binding protein [Streptomyces alfalfae]|uniref:ABC transporter transmembrane domain-containing protein n=1 Tax=Streptomyces alfalfae TaxID=1642299 RepID=UPI0009A2009B|nr:ABC transporter ATP-binding protein [Streptomyces alfalfae]AYA20091.1 ABC transporter ATP-binding protein [Streptomyces fradiae]RXX43582.1 ABC transporter ATP-binding protein [Streptomyces alfalfae]RZN01442.1 ABC transporter ATP-binding protein [Streptomyces alfalfae]